MADALTHVVADNQTLFDSGRYVAPSGTVVQVGSAIEAARTGTRHYRNDEAANLLRQSPPAVGGTTRVEVTPEATGDAGRRLTEGEGVADVAALNFASARNVGGGYLGGARAQEEQLCRTSALYPCLLRAPAYYEANRATKSLLYTDHAIYSPQVPFFRSEALSLEERPFAMSIVTSPAPNAGALLRQQPDREEQLEPTLRNRAGQVLAIAQAHGHRTLVLGAWGCGAFGNEPELVADAFARWLEGPRFEGAFERVVFAVFAPHARDARNLRAFEVRFR